MIENVGTQQAEDFVKAGLGVKYIYKDSETDEVMLTIVADNAKLKGVLERYESGDVVSSTLLDIFQQEIDRYDFPYSIEDGIWLTNGYIRGSTVFYECVYDCDLTSEDFSYADCAEMKQELLHALNETLVPVCKDEMDQNDIRIVYVYKNNNGEELARIEITADDL